MSLPLAHVAGLPIEEMLGPLTPALAIVAGAVATTLRSRWRRLRSAFSVHRSRAAARFGVKD